MLAPGLPRESLVLLLADLVLYRIPGRDEAIINALPQRLAGAKNKSADLVALNTQLGGLK